MTGPLVAVRNPGALMASAAVAVVVVGGLVADAVAASAPGAQASLAAFGRPQTNADRLAAEEAARLIVEPGSTRLLVRTPDGAHYAARTPSGELCLVLVPAAGPPSEVCVPDRVGADATIGADRQVRLVADGAGDPSAADGWRPAGPNVWVRG